MSFWQHLWRRLLGDAQGETPWLYQDAREALIDVLVLAMLIDGSPSSEEWDELRELVTQHGWRSEQPWEIYLSEAAQRAERVRAQPEARRAWCEDIAQRLPSPTLREYTLREVASLMLCDGAYGDDERALLALLAELFQIDAQRLQALLEDAAQ